MKGFPLIARTLTTLKFGSWTIRELSVELDIGYISMLRLVAELRRSGLIAPVGKRAVTKGSPAVLYAFRGGEATENGRPLTRRFLRLWNALLDADSAANIAREIGISETHVRVAIRDMHSLRLVRIAAWQRGICSVPTAIYEIGSSKDSPRPRALEEREYNRRAAERRKARRLYDALTWRLAA